MTTSHENTCVPLVSLVLPCLNEAATVGRCVEKALRSFHGMDVNGEVVVVDNGSTDRSAEIAAVAGARVVLCIKRGYGAALRAGMEAAYGSILVMADADDSYDLENLEPFLSPLLYNTADMVMGNRFLGGIEPGAMPWKNRYIGNPILSGLLRRLFGGNIGDAHCGLRSFTRAAFERMDPCEPGMEFASELVVRALQERLRIVEAPTRLFQDGRDHPPHLRPWRDGLRHLNYLLRTRWKSQRTTTTYCSMEQSVSI